MERNNDNNYDSAAGSGILREVSAADLELIGEGGNSRVYRLDENKAVKVFHENTPPDMVYYENARSREAYAAGIPCAACYGMVRVDGCLGIVYEMLDTRDLLSMIVSDKANLQGCIRDFAEQVRLMHSRKVDTARLKDAKQVFAAYLDRLEGRLCTADEIRRLKKVCGMIPDRPTFIHGDCHPGNVLTRDGRLVLIDLSSCGYGHPVFDLAGMCSIYLLSAQDESRRKSLVPARDFTSGECLAIWETFLKSYFKTEDETFLQKVREQVLGFVRVRHLLRTIIVPDEELYLYDEAKREALKYVDRDPEPLCF